MEKSKSISKREHHYKARSDQDRRSYRRSPRFPVKTFEGYVVHKDRRFKPERRLENIRVSETVISEADFTRIFEESDFRRIFKKNK